ncbi:hypothetical protein CGZ93_17880 [Enemella dayhoffiae]|uniref:Major capsid protein n=1 Tax=Enemella dayhoffiae TaxID=2016507 RepID=A0A255GLD5_9ACTN|nr:hypothetical protein [Enemella dayhoffiae]OYO16630.1 hypothetical protein CGZ93_17880 [Enemella dayhoffiae]
MYTYPTIPVSGDQLTAEQIHRLMQSPALVARRLADILSQKFIADYLLAGRYVATGGGVMYPTGEPIFAADDPEAIAAGGEYPMTVMTGGELAAAKVTKWGQDSEITDEAIARFLMDPVNRVLAGLGNTLIRHVDSVALSVIGSKVTDTYDSTATPWATGEGIVEGVLLAKATQEDKYEDMAYDLGTVVLKPIQFAKVAAYLIKSRMLPQENNNAVVSGVIPDVLGMTWTTSKHVPFTDPLLVDRDRLGGMADEDIKSPGYSAQGSLEVKVMRVDDRDAYRPRARRVTVPVVMDAGAGVRIINTGL